MEVFFLILALLLGYWLQLVFFRSFWSRGLAVNVRFSQTEVVEGQEIVLTEHIENRKRMPLPAVTLNYFLPRWLQEKGQTANDRYARHGYALRGNTEAGREMKLRCGKRGIFRIPEITLVGSDWLFLSKEYLEFPCEQMLAVAPRRVQGEVEQIPYRKLFGEVTAKRYFCDAFSEISGIREYRYGDAMRQINWRVTARQDRLMSNEFASAFERNVRIVLDTETGNRYDAEDCLETMFRFAATFAEDFLAAGYRVSLHSNAYGEAGETCVSVTGVTGAAGRSAIFRALAEISTEQKPQSFLAEWEERQELAATEDFVLFLSVLHDEVRQKWFSLRCSQGREGYWMIFSKDADAVSLVNAMDGDAGVVCLEA